MSCCWPASSAPERDGRRSRGGDARQGGHSIPPPLPRAPPHPAPPVHLTPPSKASQLSAPLWIGLTLGPGACARPRRPPGTQRKQGGRQRCNHRHAAHNHCQQAGGEGCRGELERLCLPAWQLTKQMWGAAVGCRSRRLELRLQHAPAAGGRVDQSVQLAATTKQAWRGQLRDRCAADGHVRSRPATATAAASPPHL